MRQSYNDSQVPDPSGSLIVCFSLRVNNSFFLLFICLRVDSAVKIVIKRDIGVVFFSQKKAN
jgi:hypothetical protein